MEDPILKQATPHVEALNALTAPMPTTKISNLIYFKCSVASASMHRKDGKRLSFLSGYYRTDIKEDIDFLRTEIASGNVPFVEECSGEEIAVAEASFDPKAALEKKLRAKIMEELAAEGKLVETAKAESVAVERARQQAIIGGVDQSAATSLHGQAARVGSTGIVTPVSTAQINAGAVDSTGGAPIPTTAPQAVQVKK